MIVESQFKPAWWIKNKHVQTIFQKVHRHKLQCPTIAERIELEDNDFIDLAWTEQPTEQDTRPIVLVLHGLEGSINSTYARGIMNAIRNQGWIGVLMHFRGCSEEINRNQRLYHSGETTDINYISNLIKNRYPQQKLAAIGFSLGGNALVKYLGETGKNNPLSASVSICPPLDLAASCNRITQGFSKIYQKYLLDMMQETLARKMLRVDISDKVKLNRNDIKKMKTLWHFDDKVTGPLHGFKDANDYYAQSSGKRFLHYIEKPTLVIHAKDDPFLSNHLIPKHEELSNRVTFEVSQYGGHVGFVNVNKTLTVEYWLEQRALQFIDNHLKGV